MTHLDADEVLVGVGAEVLKSKGRILVSPYMVAYLIKGDALYDVLVVYDEVSTTIPVSPVLPVLKIVPYGPGFLAWVLNPVQRDTPY